MYKPRGAKRLTACAVSLVAVVFAAPAFGVMIDNFSVALGGWPQVQGTVGGGSVQEFVGAPVLGGVRETSIAATAIGLLGADQVQVGVFPAGPAFDYASTVGADGTTGLLYDGGSGLGGVDLSTDVFLGIDFSHFDLANGIAMPISVTLTDTSAGSTVAGGSVTTAGAQTVQFALAAFAGVDLTMIDSIEIDFDPGMGTDFRLELIETYVPEPATLGVLLLGSLACLRRGRLR